MSESRDPEMNLREGDVITHRREDCQTKYCVLDPKVIRCRDKEARSDLFLLFTAGNLVKGDAPPRVRNVDDAVYALESTIDEAVQSFDMSKQGGCAINARQHLLMVRA